MQLIIDDLSSNEIEKFLDEHIQEMKAISSPESKHALDLEGLRSSNITFWTVYDENLIAGCGAIMELNQFQGEIKSMRTLAYRRGKGIASKLLNHIIETAKSRGYKKLNLESGSIACFEPAHQLYLNTVSNFANHLTVTKKTQIVCLWS